MSTWRRLVVSEADMVKLTLLNPDVFRVFVKPGEVVEVRIPKVHGKCQAWGGEFARGTVSGYFDDHLAFCEALKLVDKAKHEGVYFTLQVIDHRLLARAFNRLKPAILTTSDTNVLAYRWIPIDIDPVRPAGISSSEAELTAAVKAREEVAEYLMQEFHLSPPIRAISGNGAHLLFRLPDLPANDETKAFIRHTLEGLAVQFNSDRVTIDQTVFNPARIWKLYGTTSRKGDQLPANDHREARPHRLAYIEDIGGNL